MGKLLMVRHGQTDMNLNKIYFGWLDPELNQIGIKQAKNVKKILKEFSYDHIYSSDLKRAKKTAQIINYLQKDIVYDKRIRELNFGVFEGMTYEEILLKYPSQYELSSKEWKTYDFEIGESPMKLQRRAINFIESLDLKKDNLVITHWGVINCILSWYFSKELDSYWKYSVENGGICVIEFIDGFPILKGLNIK